ncbi:gliding motility protein GldC [Fulvivirga ligni]|uniref:gliding motility protein GldC n=1 Tax=Fulvivirga ligni TaxID=2904246 RepID=UPI001F233CA2|nr:gliding motility protein GldC [Fulvivirga ligni]UII20974.1 gliding motility protein GldC [Fulvivirga ligni]
MKKSEINFTVELDADNIPERIKWDATEKPDGQIDDTKSISVSLWDDVQKNTMRIDLWTKDMPVDEMKRFYVDCLGGMAQTILRSTGDEFMSTEINDLCEKLVEHLKREAEGN